MALGLLRLMTKEQREEVFRLLSWESLDRHAKLIYFSQLPYEKQNEIRKTIDRKKREALTAEAYRMEY